MLKKLKPLDLIILFLTILLIICSFYLNNKEGAYLLVEADGVHYEFPLSKDGKYSVKGILGVTVIEVKDGKARIISSPCPNKTCISSGYQSTLICLPNKVIATIGDSAIDESTY